MNMLKEKRLMRKIIVWCRERVALHAHFLIWVGIFSLVVGIVCLLAHLRTSRVDDIKDHAAKVLEYSGYDVVGYEGYQGGLIGDYGGTVWYTVVRRGEPHGFLYNVALTRWGSEYHIYNLRNVDSATHSCQ